ncbi:MAG: tetratricopeptide repeat protein, partial [Gammaproteobacteria bacterium]
MKSSYQKPKEFHYRGLWISLILMAVLALNSCATINQQGGAEGPDTAGARSELSGDLLYELLVGEFAGNAGDTTLAIESYDRAAMITQDARVAARATYIAVYSEQYEKALDLLERWEKLEPEDPDIPRLYATTYLKLGQPLSAAAYIQSILDTVEGNGHDKALAVKRLLAKESSVEDGLIVLD